MCGLSVYVFSEKKWMKMLCKYSEAKICDGCMCCYDTDYNDNEVEEYDSDFDFDEREDE